MPDESQVRSSPAVFTPGNEPYLGRGSVWRLDVTIVEALKANRATADLSHRGQLTDLQRAACQILPQGISIALSIRELIRQGYLFSAFILLRPLIERSAIISYLVKHPDSVEMWNDGWQHGKRPSLFKMLQAMQRPDADTSLTRDILELTNHAVHGDPLAAEWNKVGLVDGGIGYSSGRILDRPDFCDAVADNAFPYLIVLMAMMLACFLNATEARQAIVDAIDRVIPKQSQETGNGSDGS